MYACRHGETVQFSIQTTRNLDMGTLVRILCPLVLLNYCHMFHQGGSVPSYTTCAASRAESKCMTRASCTTLLCFSNTGTTSQSDIRQQIGTFSVLL